MQTHITADCEWDWILIAAQLSSPKSLEFSNIVKEKCDSTQKSSKIETSGKGQRSAGPSYQCQR